MGNDHNKDLDRTESREWLESLDWVIKNRGEERVRVLLRELQNHAALNGITLPYAANTPYINTIPEKQQPPYPGNREIERRIKSIIRWNAMAMVVRANKNEEGIGGHISTYASAATLYEVAFNHFFQGKESEGGGDQIYFQGHASPGIYARAFLEGRLSEEHLNNFRREMREGGGLSSYPHPWLMPNFWEFPTVSMGLGPVMAIYQARFNRYLMDRGLLEHSGRVWAFLGDGETDEPEALGAITLAGRERLDNLTFVINCNLQRLDGPVRGNGKIIQELEAIFRGAGWNVIKVIWGSEWDPLLERDEEGLLVRRMEEVVDGEYQKYSVESGSYIRKHFFGKYDSLEEMVRGMSDEELRKLKRGGHDPEKVYAAYRSAVEHRGAPTVILAKTVKGYGLGESGEGKNITHQQKKLNEEELLAFRSRFGIPVSDEEAPSAPFYRPPEESPEMAYLHERRKQLGGYVPGRVTLRSRPLSPPLPELFREFYEGTGERTASTTMVFVRMLAQLLKDENVKELIVPIIPDEARTFGMEALFRQVGIYSSQGQKYEPVDSATLLYYKEAKNGQILEEGITEAGGLASFIAAGTAYVSHALPMIPFFTFYSMFGFQRVGDLIWAAGDMRARGFLLGGTAGRTTLAGEGLQHQDGHSHLLAYPHPNVLAYDPAFAYELAVLIEEGIRRMYFSDESLIYYITIGNETYVQPPMPEDRDEVREGILRGMYLYERSETENPAARVRLLGSGAILNEVREAARLLRERYSIASTVWSVTSYKLLYQDGLDTDRWNTLHPGQEPKTPLVQSLLEGEEGPVVAASDYVKTLPLSVARWIPAPFVALGTDGFGRSESRSALRDFFEVDARHIALAALSALSRTGEVPRQVVSRAMEELRIDPETENPLFR